MKKVLLIICIIMMLSGCGAENPPHKAVEEGFDFESSYHEEKTPTNTRGRFCCVSLTGELI